MMDAATRNYARHRRSEIVRAREGEPPTKKPGPHMLVTQEQFEQEVDIAIAAYEAARTSKRIATQELLADAA